MPKIVEKLRVLDEVGLGYLRLGQSATTLSGGEAQRMKLAAHLQPKQRDFGRTQLERNRRHPRVLYIFDEPTTGLHFDDVSKLLAAFRRLIEAGGSIVVIEHNLDVIKTADWVIDLRSRGWLARRASRSRWASGRNREGCRFLHRAVVGSHLIPNNGPGTEMRHRWTLVLASALGCWLGARRAGAPLHADQESKPTVRHHQIEVQSDDSTSPEINQAEAAMAEARLHRCRDPAL